MLAWVARATTWPKMAPKVGFTSKTRPAQPFPPRRDDAIDTLCPLHKVISHCPPQQDSPPLCETHPDTPCMYKWVGGVYHCASASARSNQKVYYFASSCGRQYLTVTATSCHGSSARFDRDIGYIIIDVSLLFGGIASSVRGCRPQHVDFLRNKPTRGDNALASTASPNKPITLPPAHTAIYN